MTGTESYPNAARQAYLYTSRREMADHVFPVANHLGFDLSDEAKDRQRQMAGCVALIDYMWDNDPDSHEPFLAYCSDLEENGARVEPPGHATPSHCKRPKRFGSQDYT